MIEGEMLGIGMVWEEMYQTVADDSQGAVNRCRSLAPETQDHGLTSGQ